MSKSRFCYNLKDDVILNGSNEAGSIIGRAHFTSQDPQYLVRYVAADGRLTESWWDEAAISLMDGGSASTGSPA